MEGKNENTKREDRRKELGGLKKEKELRGEEERKELGKENGKSWEEERKT